jgi:hypothetical protein
MKAAVKRATKTARQVEAAEKEGRELAVDVLRQTLTAFRDVAEAFRPGTRRKPNKGANLAEFEKWSRLVLRACELLAPFETPKALVPPATDAIEATTVTVSTEVNVDLSTLTTEQLIARYRSRIAGGPLPIDPKHFADAAALPSPEAPGPALPAATVTNTPIEAIEETGEKLVEITGEPLAAEPAGERTAPPTNVIPLNITPEVLARASVPPGVLAHSRSIAASVAGPQSYGAHQGNPLAGQPIPDEAFRAATRHPAMPRTSGVFD